MTWVPELPWAVRLTYSGTPSPAPLSHSLPKQETSEPNKKKNVLCLQYSSEPRRSVSLPIHAERDGTIAIGQHSGKSKGLFKALLSMHKSKREGILYK